MNDVQADETDRQDMARLVAGADSALNSLMERHGPRLFNYLLRLLQNEVRASDAAQESFVKVYLNREKFRTNAKFSTWLYAIATNIARDHLRWKQRHPEVSIDTESDDHPKLAEVLPDSSESPSEILAQEERAAQVRNAVQALPEELRMPLILAEYEDQSHAEIAKILNCTIKAVEMRIYRARQALRNTLAGLAEAN